MKESYFIDEDDLIFKRATINDNFNDIANLIYESDKNIYQYWFKDKEEANKIITKLINDENSIFNYNNLYVCYSNSENKIIGVLLAIDNTISLDYNYDEINTNNNSSIIIDNYIKPLISNVKKNNNENTMFIQSICINERFRSKGVGSKLMGYFINQMEGSGFNEFKLSCPINNLRAKNLFHSMGFKEINLHKRFSIDSNTIIMVNFLRKRGNYFISDFKESKIEY